MNKKDHGLLYQVVVSLGKPFRIISFEGPYKGAAADVSIFRATILPHLLEGEKVMCDKGYIQEERCWCPPGGSYSDLTLQQKIDRRQVTSIRHLVERVICVLKSFGFLRRRWGSSFEDHELATMVIAKLTQLLLYTHELT